MSIACFTEKQKFRMDPDGDFESDQLEDFIDRLKSGKLKPYMRSMAVPKKQDNLPVLKIVANNYDVQMHKVSLDGWRRGQGCLAWLYLCQVSFLNE